MDFKRVCAYRSFWPKVDVVERFGKLGVDTVCVFPGNTLNSLGTPYTNAPPNWLHEDIVDWGIVDAQFDRLIAANSNIRLICMVDLNSPTWLTRYFRCDDTFCDLGKVSGHEEWRRVTAEYMRQMLRHVEEKYGERIAAYILMNGATDEWQDLSQGQESPSRRACWRRWCQEKGYGDPVDIPKKSERDAAAHGLLRDPVDDAWAIRYADFSRWMIRDVIEYFTSEAQGVIKHRVPLGIFFGYVLEHAGSIQSLGHLDYDKVFASPHLDFFVSPVSYQDREMGGASGIMLTLDSLKLHGKGYIREIDHLTPTSNACPQPMSEKNSAKFTSWNPRWPDEPSSIVGLRREFALDLISGDSFWWFDMWNHWYETEGILSALRQMREIWDAAAQQPNPGPAAEIAVIVDAESCLYLNQYSEHIRKLLYTLRKPLGRIGAPYSLFSFADLDKIDFSAYKLVVMPNYFYHDDKRMAALRDKVLGGGRTVLWIHQAGVIAGDNYDLGNVEALTGIPYSPGTLQTIAQDGWTSVLHSDLEPTLEVLWQVAEQSGVHLYGEVGEPVYANTRYLASHSATGGIRKFRLPRTCKAVRDVFNDQIVARDCCEFEAKLETPDTVLYELLD